MRHQLNWVSYRETLVHFSFQECIRSIVELQKNTQILLVEYV